MQKQEILRSKTITDIKYPTNLHKSTSQAMEMCVPPIVPARFVMAGLRAFISLEVISHESGDTIVMLSVLIHVRFAREAVGAVVSCTVIVAGTLNRTCLLACDLAFLFLFKTVGNL